MNRQALTGLKVLEYSQSVAGDYCGKLLADLGAEVIKVEEPGSGDKVRSWGPFPKDIPHPEKSGMFLLLNTNKLGVTLNLRTATGLKIFRELVQRVDILVESNLPREMKQLGLDYESLHKLNPALVMTSITAFGQTGPYRDYKGCDLINYSMGGGAYYNPAEGVDNVEEFPPLKVPAHGTDFMSGASAAVSTMSAVIARKTSGLGQHVDVSQQEALTSVARNQIISYSQTGMLTFSRAKRGGSNLFPCKDGYVCLYLMEDLFWPSLKKMLGNPDWTKEEWCQDPARRAQNAKKFHEVLVEWTSQHTMDEVYQAAIANRIPCSPVRSVKDLFTDEQLTARDFFVEIDHPAAGRLKYPGAPYKLSATPWTVKRPAPLLGEHNEKVYCQMLGYTRQDLVKMRETGVI